MKKMVSILMALILGIGLSVSGEVQVQASDSVECIDGSYLLDDVTEDIGNLGISTRGYYLSSGTSSIVDNGTGKIAAGGDTAAHRIVDDISITVVVQRLVNGSWQNYLTWSASKTNAAYVSTSKVLYVPTGYYYRVSCSHYASTDTGYSYTNGIYID